MNRAKTDPIVRRNGQKWKNRSIHHHHYEMSASYLYGRSLISVKLTLLFLRFDVDDSSVLVSRFYSSLKTLWLSPYSPHYLSGVVIKTEKSYCDIRSFSFHKILVRYLSWWGHIISTLDRLVYWISDWIMCHNVS